MKPGKVSTRRSYWWGRPGRKMAGTVPVRRRRSVQCGCAWESAFRVVSGWDFGIGTQHGAQGTCGELRLGQGRANIGRRRVGAADGHGVRCWLDLESWQLGKRPGEGGSGGREASLALVLAGAAWEREIDGALGSSSRKTEGSSKAQLLPAKMDG
jgi:hypothetical protein